MAFKDFIRGAYYTTLASALGAVVFTLASNEIARASAEKAQEARNSPSLERTIEQTEQPSSPKLTLESSVTTQPASVAKQETRPVYKTQEKPKEQDMSAFAKYTGKWEGRKSKVYDPIPNDKKWEPTVGIGHYLGDKDAKAELAKVLPEVKYDKLIKGEIELTDNQIDRLFAYDTKDHLERTKKAFPKFDEYPEYVQTALFDGFYRGDLSGSPDTRKLINEGKWKEASVEYLENREYTNAEKLGRPGIRPRMEANRDAMVKYANSLKVK